MRNQTMKKSKWPLLIIAASMLYGCTGNGEPDTSVYMDAAQPTEKRVEALLSQMTLEEKIGQMDMVPVWDKEKIKELGQLDYGAWIGEGKPDVMNEIQQLSEQTRLKIPYLIGVDAAHGYGVLSGKRFSVRNQYGCNLQPRPGESDVRGIGF